MNTIAIAPNKTFDSSDFRLLAEVNEGTVLLSGATYSIEHIRLCGEYRIMYLMPVTSMKKS